MEVYTIGFTKKTAAEFFGAIRRAGIKRLLDVRLNNSSQLAGFTKREDLAYFLKELCWLVPASAAGQRFHIRTCSLAASQ